MRRNKVTHIYEVRPRKDHRGVDLISDALPFGRLWYREPNAIANAIGYAEHSSRSNHAVIRIYDAASNMTETHEYEYTLTQLSFSYMYLRRYPEQKATLQRVLEITPDALGVASGVPCVDLDWRADTAPLHQFIRIR